MRTYFTTGQVARKLRVSISTLKRWLNETEQLIADRRNQNGWRLFSEEDVELLRKHKRELKKNGKRFNNSTLVPVVVSNQKISLLG